jgi:hypothetical protein
LHSFSNRLTEARWCSGADVRIRGLTAIGLRSGTTPMHPYHGVKSPRSADHHLGYHSHHGRRVPIELDRQPMCHVGMVTYRHGWSHRRPDLLINTDVLGLDLRPSVINPLALSSALPEPCEIRSTSRCSREYLLKLHVSIGLTGFQAQSTEGHCQFDVQQAHRHRRQATFIVRA